MDVMDGNSIPHRFLFALAAVRFVHAVHTVHKVHIVHRAYRTTTFTPVRALS